MRVVKNHRYNMYTFAGIVSFVLVSLYIAPFTHEIFHVLVLKFNECNYWTDFHTDTFKGLYGGVYQMCYLSKSSLFWLYMSGILGNILLALLFFAFDYYLITKKHVELSNLVLLSAIGFLTDPILYTFQPYGDIMSALQSIGKETLFKFVPLFGLGLSLTLIVYMLYTLKHIEDIELIQTELMLLEKIKTKKKIAKKLKRSKLDKTENKLKKKARASSRSHRKYMPKE